MCAATQSHFTVWPIFQYSVFFVFRNDYGCCCCCSHMLDLQMKRKWTSLQRYNSFDRIRTSWRIFIFSYIFLFDNSNVNDYIYYALGHLFVICTITITHLTDFRFVSFTETRIKTVKVHFKVDNFFFVNDCDERPWRPTNRLSECKETRTENRKSYSTEIKSSWVKSVNQVWSMVMRYSQRRKLITTPKKNSEFFPFFIDRMITLKVVCDADFFLRLKLGDSAELSNKSSLLQKLNHSDWFRSFGLFYWTFINSWRTKKRKSFLLRTEKQNKNINEVKTEIVRAISGNDVHRPSTRNHRFNIHFKNCQCNFLFLFIQDCCLFLFNSVCFNFKLLELERF